MEQVVVRRGQIRRIGWVIKKPEAKVDKFLLCFMCLVSRNIVVRGQEHLGELPTVFFLQNVLQLDQQKLIIFRFNRLALWKIINEKDAVSIPKN